MSQPIDTWSYDLAFKHGMRDGLTCPVGERWAISFWSREELSSIVTRPMRIMMCATISFAALRLDQLVGSTLYREERLHESGFGKSPGDTTSASMMGSSDLAPDLAAPSPMAVRAAISKAIVLESTSSPE